MAMVRKVQDLRKQIGDLHAQADRQQKALEDYLLSLNVE
jgi:hypothetical protein